VLAVATGNFCLQAWLPSMPFDAATAPRGFVAAPQGAATRPRRSVADRSDREAVRRIILRAAASQDEALAAENERLKAELAAMRGQAAPAPAPVVAQAEVPDAADANADDKFKLRSTITKVLEDLRVEIKDIEDARLGFTESGNFMYAQDQDDPAKNVIFKRKSEVLQASLGQQEACMRAIGAAFRKGKELESVKSLVEMDQKEKKNPEYVELKRMYMEGNQWVDIVFKDVVPKVAEDPVKDTIFGLLATGILVGATLLACLCLFPPFIPPDA